MLDIFIVALLFYYFFYTYFAITLIATIFLLPSHERHVSRHALYAHIRYYLLLFFFFFFIAAIIYAEPISFRRRHLPPEVFDALRC